MPEGTGLHNELLVMDGTRTLTLLAAKQQGRGYKGKKQKNIRGTIRIIIPSVANMKRNIFCNYTDTSPQIMLQLVLQHNKYNLFLYAEKTKDPLL